MKRDEFEAMGDLHKKFECREESKLMPGLPVVARLDGRAFHTFTRGLARPYDERLSRAMIETTKYLVDETHATVGYTQSDEITLAWASVDTDKPIMFDGRVQKLVSILAATASVKFNQQLLGLIPEKAHLLPVLDCRAYQYPNRELASEAFLWRETDATRNSLTMAAHAYYSPKELHKAGYAKKHEMLHAKGVNWAEYPDFFKKGTYVRRQAQTRLLTEAELARIPAKHRPTGPVTRTALVEMDIAPLHRLANRTEVLFDGAVPVLLKELLAAVA